MKRRVLGAGLMLVLSAAVFLLLPGSPRAEDIPRQISLPPGFSIDYFAPKVKEARSLARGDKGTIFVGTRHAGKVYALQDLDGDWKADKLHVIAEGLEMPNGVAFRDGALYVAEINRILRFDAIEERLDNPPRPVVVTDAYPSNQAHGWKFIRFGPDGYLYVPVGAPCNICLSSDPRYASITRIKPDGTEMEIFASGVRNSVGFDWHPQSKELWFTDNGRDMLGDNLPPCELNHAPRKGMHFGYPFCHGSDIRDPEFGHLRKCSEFTPPAQELGPHVAPLGMRFYTGEMFPAEYRGRIFIAEHGSWNRSERIGYRLTQVELSEQGKATSYRVFAEGWLDEDKDILGRPVDLLQLPDGSLLVSDDYAGAIYRIAYSAG